MSERYVVDGQSRWGNWLIFDRFQPESGPLWELSVVQVSNRALADRIARLLNSDERELARREAL